MRILVLFALLFSGVLAAAQETRQFDTPAQRALYQELSDELRCPKCQNQNIADSNANIAKDLRNKVYQLVKEGQNKQQVVDFMVERYGYFVYYKPPVTLGTLVLWLLPILFILATLFLIWFKAKRSQRVQQSPDWNDEQEQQLQALIDNIEQAKEQ